jgi:nucleotide-binding universal stress UspA family protein
MYRHLLVPLDGSSLAEVALPYAAYIAQMMDATVTLIHVIERNPPQTVHGVTHLTNADNAQHYLDEVATRAFTGGIKVLQHVHTSEVTEVARSIVDHVGEFKPDLIVMCTHGNGGLRDWLSASIAQQVLAQGNVAVLLVPPRESHVSHPIAIRRILVPLDGDVAHEQGIQAAVGFAQISNAAIHLLLVVHTPGTLSGAKAATSRMLPGMTAELLKITEQEAQSYLQGHVAVLQGSGLSITAEVARGDPAKTIVSIGKRIGADLIVLGTHGKSGMDAFWQGSVAPQVSNHSYVPLLLVRVQAG